MPQQARDIEKIAEGLRPLLETEDRFAIGDYLIENGPLRPSELATLAQLVHHEKSTLETYLKVSTVFPQSRRNYGLAWGIFKQLARIDDEEWQDKFLADYPNPTTSATERAVNAKLTTDRGTAAQTRRRVSGRAWVPGVDIDVTLEDQVNGRIVLNGDIDKAAVVYSEVHGKWTVEFTLRQREVQSA
jgi:hypothetical protein